MSISYLELIILTLALGLGASALVNSRLKKYSRVQNGLGLTGVQAAQQMLNYFGLGNVEIHRGTKGQDFFDPRTNSITLSPDAYNDDSVTGIATACHEVGHACQFAFGYTPMKIRTSLVPVVNLCNNVWIFVFFLGIIMNLMGFIWIAIFLYAAVVLFAVITLPVEFNASNRAMQYMDSIGLGQEAYTGAGKVLRACAYTYLASALASLLQLLYLLGNVRDE